MFTKGHKINDRYQIVRTIGEGGMANVYLALDTILDRKVAVKVLRGDLANDEKFVRRFQREALSASSLSHPNIIEVYDVGEEENNYYIVMEYIDGKNLKELVKKRGNLTLFETSDIMLQLTDGLACAHESYIVHRDIKPQNILMLENGMIKITDFGIALAVNNLSLTQTNSVMGSVHYLPPEQASGKGSTIKSDIYSLGILMYELLVGKVPFRGDTAVEIALKHMKEPFPDIRKINPDIPQAVENIILKACAKNPKNRYTNVREMHDDIITCLDEDRANEPKVVFQYLEQELDETKTIPVVKEVKKPKDIKKEEDEILDEDDTKEEIAIRIKNEDNKKQKIIVLILSSILLCLMVLFAFIILVLPQLNTTKEVTIPDVANMTITDAEAELEAAGLTVADKIKEVNDDVIEKDAVVKTSPSIGRTVKEGTEVTIYISIGTKKITLEDYTGQDATAVKAKLEALKLNVIITTTSVADSSKYTENEIVKQDPLGTTKVTEGETVTLYIINKEVYPDMVADAWNEDAATEFATKYNLVLNVIEEESTIQAGTVIYQSRKAGSTITAGSTLTIKVAVAATVEQEPTE